MMERSMENKETEILDLLKKPIENFADRSSRWLFENKENVRGLIEIVASELVEHLDFTQLTQLNRSFVSDTLREQESDILYSVPFHGETRTDELLIYILIEHQSTVDVTMGFRVLFYMTQIWDTQRREWESNNVPKSEWRLHPILPIVFYTGSQQWQTPLSLTSLMDIPEVLSRFVPTYDTLFLSVKETEASDLTKTGHPLGWLLSVLQQEHADVDAIKRVLLSTLSHLNSLDVEQTQQRERAILYLLLLVLHRRPAKEHASLISLIDGQTHGMEVESMAESIIEQSRKQGLEQGETRAKREAILKLLQVRFDVVPEAMTRKISAMQNRALLDSLFEEAATAQTLDDIDWENSDN